MPLSPLLAAHPWPAPAHVQTLQWRALFPHAQAVVMALLHPSICCEQDKDTSLAVPLSAWEAAGDGSHQRRPYSSVFAFLLTRGTKEASCLLGLPTWPQESSITLVLLWGFSSLQGGLCLTVLILALDCKWVESYMPTLSSFEYLLMHELPCYYPSVVFPCQTSAPCNSRP